MTLLFHAGLSKVLSAEALPSTALGLSRRRLHGLTALFSVDAFGGSIVNLLPAL